MTVGKPSLGLSWEPKLPSLSTGNKNLQKFPESRVWKDDNMLIDGLFVPPNDPRKLKDTAGRNWFEIPAPTITPEIKKDLQILKLRSVIDPKRHYKKGDLKSKTLPKYFQVGTVVESASDFFAGRITKKERKATLADELLSDRALGEYRKRKVQEIEEQNRSIGGVGKWKIKGKQSWKHAKQRRHR